MSPPRAARTRSSPRRTASEPRRTASGRSRSLYLPPWRIDVATRPGVRVPVGVSRLAAAVAEALTAARAPEPSSIGLILSHDRELAELNERAMGRSEPTDVLSFPLLPPDAFPSHRGAPTRPRGPRPEATFPLPPGRRAHLGDIVISAERAIEQAESGAGGQTGDVRWSAADELILLAIHGALHVCGWDHAEPDEERAMRKLERTLLDAAPDPGAGPRTDARRRSSGTATRRGRPA